jgi:hypothetical protein
MSGFLLLSFLSAFLIVNVYLLTLLLTNKLLSIMAKVKFSALISEMRGKLNGSVFSKNRGGSYIRTKVTPVNPNTSSQALARSTLSSISQNWRGLAETERIAWNNAVSSFKSTDVFGDIKTPSGLQLFIRLNVNIFNAGGAAITSPPTPVGVDPVTSIVLVADGTLGTYVATISPDPVPADHALYVESTEGLSAGISNANSRFRSITVVPAGAIPLDFVADQVAKFGALVTGQKYFMRVKMIRVSTGEVSGTLLDSSIAI